MTSRNYDWLGSTHEDDDDANISEEEEESRHNTLKSVQRRITALEKDTDQGPDDEEGNNGDGHDSQDESNVHDVENVTIKDTEPVTIDSGSKVRTLKSLKKLHRKADDASRTGVIYISRIPPFMKPHTLRGLLLPYAKHGLGRIFLTPEPQAQRQSRLRAGGNKKRTFVDGWVEFVRKREAKDVVSMLNTSTIGGKKGGYYRDDVWSMRYLRGFKWGGLMEQVRNEEAERDARLRAEAALSRRQMREFLGNVERSKIEETRKRKRIAKGDDEEQVVVTEETELPDSKTRPKSRKKDLKPKLPITKEFNDQDVQKTINKIF